jgi:hypothetical protein
MTRFAYTPPVDARVAEHVTIARVGCRAKMAVLYTLITSSGHGTVMAEPAKFPTGVKEVLAMFGLNGMISH